MKANSSPPASSSLARPYSFISVLCARPAPRRSTTTWFRKWNTAPDWRKRPRRQQPRYPTATVLRLQRPSPFCHSACPGVPWERSRPVPACRGGICCAPFGCPKFTGLPLPSLCRIEAGAAPLTIARPVRRFALAGFGSSGSGNGLNVRTMRTEFPPGRKGGEPQQENRLGLGLGMVSQGAPGAASVSGGGKMGSGNGSNVRTMRTSRVLKKSLSNAIRVV